MANKDGLVNGFGPIVNRNNLVGNGNFSINQRGTYTTWTPLVLDDYVADLWQAVAVTVDYAECIQISDDGTLGFRGFGRKGQYIYVRSREYLSNGIPRMNDSEGYGTITAAVDIRNSGEGYVQVEGVVSPAFRTSDNPADLLDYRPISKMGVENTITPVKAMNSLLYLTDQLPWFQVHLRADGEFNFSVSNFRMLAGAYRNVPHYCPVNYADDFVRCQRYYQVGRVIFTVVPMFATSSEIRTRQWTSFQARMAGTPSITTNLTFVRLYEAPPSSGTTEETSAWGNNTASLMTFDGFLYSMNRSKHTSPYINMEYSMDWTAHI